MIFKEQIRFWLSLPQAVVSLIVLAIGITLSAPATSSIIMIEDFESGSYDSQWSLMGSDVSNIHAKDGIFGSGDVGWTYRTDFSLELGDRLQIWARVSSTGSGRFYLGFGADATGSSSFVLANNTGDIRFQNNPGYSHNELNTSFQSFVANSWYLTEIFFAPSGDIVGNLYGNDGTTLLNSLTAVGVTNTLGGIALRSFGNWSFDSLQVVRSNGEPVSVPAPSTLILLGLGLGMLRAAFRRRRAGNSEIVA